MLTSCCWNQVRLAAAHRCRVVKFDLRCKDAPVRGSTRHNQSPIDISFEAWLAAHPLPGSNLASPTSTGLPTAATPLTEPHNKQALKAQRFSWQTTPTVVRACLRANTLAWEASKACYVGTDINTGTRRCQLRLPRILSPPTDVDPLAHVSELAAQEKSPACGSQLLVLLSADSAALGLWREGRLLRHKVLTGYTVRRKQGKAQLTHERQGSGRRSLGGGIRARETRRLFQAASSKLAEW